MGFIISAAHEKNGACLTYVICDMMAVIII